MVKSNIKIDFHEKRMGLLEAKLFLCELKLGLLNLSLDDKEKADYLRWKGFRENRNEIKKRLVKEVTYTRLTERDYLIEGLENEIKSVKQKKKNRDYCKVNGHIEKKGSAYTQPGVKGAQTYYTCLRCGSIYEKNFPSEEDNKSNKINNPFSA